MDANKEMTMTKQTVQVVFPRTPGATPTVREKFATVAQAREYAAAVAGRRPDLSYQDIRIELIASGQRIEYAGPVR
jgi:hypothetical protein